MARILVVDDDRETCRFMHELLREPDREIETAETPGAALALLAGGRFDLVLSDINLNAEESGLDLLRAFKASDPEVEVVLISAFGTLETALEAVKAGAFDYVSKPVDIGQVREVVARALARRARAGETRPAAFPAGRTAPDGLVGRSGAMLGVYKQIALACISDAPVLVTGETGTGKELVARAIHDSSLVKAGPFVQVNCAAIPDTLIESELFGHERGSFTGADRKQTGKFVEADGGTIFLDEVGDMSAPAQAKVLRVLQEGEVEPVGSPRVVKVKVRVVAATNRDLTTLIAQGKFREDLYYLLNVLVLRTPPLGERREDVPSLVTWFAEQFAKTNNYRPKRFTDAALEALAARAWPGNVRELKNHVERLMIMSDADVLDAADVDGGAVVPAGDAGPVTVRGGRVVDPASAGTWERLVGIGTLQEFQDETERLFLVAKLAENGGNVTRTAEAIDTPRSNLYKKIDRYGLRRDREGSEP